MITVRMNSLVMVRSPAVVKPTWVPVSLDTNSCSWEPQEWETYGQMG